VSGRQWLTCVILENAPHYYAPAPIGEAGALSGHRHLSSVRLSDVTYIGSNSKTKRPRKTKLCTGVSQVTCDSHTDFKVKRSKVKVGRGILWRRPSRTACYYLNICMVHSVSSQSELEAHKSVIGRQRYSIDELLEKMIFQTLFEIVKRVQTL